MNQTLVIGDSFVEGVGAPVNKGWAYLLKENLQQDSVDVSGEGGDTTEKIIRRFPHVPYERYIVQIGTNDSRYRPSLKTSEIPEKKFRDNLSRIIKIINNANQEAKVIFVGLLFVDEIKTIPYKEDKVYKNTLLRQYDKYIAELCESSGFKYVSLESMLGELSFLSDGVHPSEKGHREIFKLVKQSL